MAVDLKPLDHPDHLASYAHWLADKRRNNPAEAALFQHDVRTRAAVGVGLLDKSYLGDVALTISPPLRGQAARIDKHFADWMAGFVPLRPAKRLQPAERQPPAMSASVYGNLFKRA